MVDAADIEPEPTGSRLDDWWMRRSARTRSIVRWAAPAAVIAIAAVTRLWNLGHPHLLVFDETYYVKDAWTLWNLGYESQWPAESDQQFNGGVTDIFTTNASYVVHPPLGKWIIGVGMALLGPDNPVGWRISVAIVGILLVVLTMLVAKRLTGSQLLATTARVPARDRGQRDRDEPGRAARRHPRPVRPARRGRDPARPASGRGCGSPPGSRRARMPGDDIHWGPALWNRPWLIAAGVAFGARRAP